VKSYPEFIGLQMILKYVSAFEDSFHIMTFYIGGQRLDASAKTNFVWKHPVESGKPHQQLTYTNWADGEPNYCQNNDRGVYAAPNRSKFHVE
jgi:hypothetical protein